MSTTQPATPSTNLTQWFDDIEKHHLERLQAEYGITGNPLYVWEALHSLLTHPRNEALAAALPGWIKNYLTRAAMLIVLLTAGIDHLEAEKLERQGLKGIDAVMAAMGKTSPSEATKRVGEILGFEKRGRNAFSQYKTRSEMVEDLADYGDMLDEGTAAHEAIKDIMERRRIYDERTIRRRLAAARAIFQEKSPSNRADTTAGVE